MPIFCRAPIYREPVYICHLLILTPPEKVPMGDFLSFLLPSPLPLAKNCHSLPHFIYCSSDRQQSCPVIGHHKKKREREVEELQENGKDEKKLKKWRVIQNSISCGHPLKRLSRVSERHKEEVTVFILSHFPHSTSLSPSESYYPLCTSLPTSEHLPSFYLLILHPSLFSIPPTLPLKTLSSVPIKITWVVSLAFSLSDSHYHYHQWAKAIADFYHQCSACAGTTPHCWKEAHVFLQMEILNQASQRNILIRGGCILHSS